MGLNISVVRESIGSSLGALKCLLVDVTFDDSYLTGGESLAAGDVPAANIHQILAAVPAGGNAAAASYLVEWVQSTQKLILFEPTSGSAGPGTQVASTTDVSGVTVRLLLIGW